MKKILVFILIAIAFASAKDYTKVFMQLIDKLENCELSKDTTTEYFGRELAFKCNEDTIEVSFDNSRDVINSVIGGISFNTKEYYNGIKVTAYRYFRNSGHDLEGEPYKGYYGETFFDELNVIMHEVKYTLNKDLDAVKIYTYFRQKMK